MKLALGLILAAAAASAAPGPIAFSQSAPAVEAWDFVEVAIRVEVPDVRNPFVDASVTGSFGKSGSRQRLNVEGFCDSPDGSLFRIRFLASSPGDYAYSVTYREAGFEKSYDGAFHATDGHRRGPIGVDPKYPWHFLWEGTGSITSSTAPRRSG